MRLEDFPVIQLFLALRGIDCIFKPSSCKFLISYPSLTKRLQIFDPVESNSFTLHRLRSPKNWIWYFAVKKHTKCVFLWFTFAFNPLQLRVHLCEGATKFKQNLENSVDNHVSARKQTCMTVSITLGSRKGTRASSPWAIVMRSARWQLTLCR